MTDLNRTEADDLCSTPKVINEDIEWKPLKGRYRLDVPVLAPQMGKFLKLSGNIGKTNHSFVLLFEGLPIRKYTVHYRHRLPDGTTIEVPHKHTWDDIHQDETAYVPDDIDPDADINDQLLQFLAEENIRLAGNYQRLMPPAE